MSYNAGNFDVVVIGAGHAGVEAGLAAARMGCKTLLCTLSLESVAMMPCNPNIGGTAKGHIVREIDALGGEMGKNIDKSYIQTKMLNTSKGPAVHSLRAQADKNLYQQEMKRTVEGQENLQLRQIEVVDVDVVDGEVKGVLTRNGAYFTCKSVILTSGTYLKSKIYIGDNNFNEGPNGLVPANRLSEKLLNLGIELRRFKTGTPCRVNKRSIDFSKLIEQPGDSEVSPFSFLNEKNEKKQISCWLGYTNEKTQAVIEANMDRSPMYNGTIKSIGPRYCPSIEDKMKRFPDKVKHQIFLEPEGSDTDEMYVGGMSSSLPEDVQVEMIRTMEGFENAEIMRTGYAIEYDCIDATILLPSLEMKEIKGFFAAGQVNGSSGYEEAAGQGLVAGINASLRVQEKEALILKRSDAYIGVLIDDLVTKGTTEPYRMMTSRAEYRLLLRQDNADLRLTQMGREAGLVDDERYSIFAQRKQNIENEIERLKEVAVTTKNETNDIVTKLGSTELKKPISLYELIKRPELDYFMVAELDLERPEIPRNIGDQMNVMAKYEGYISNQLEQVEKFKKLERRFIPEDMDYSLIHNLRTEAVQKLTKIKPLNIGQASRISGVSPSDISVLLIQIEQLRGKK
ncbi:tRNA uridine-5-carboxymethylaminomethyl(34) synthesis enzyme MnmG [uncultured Clostridium sp.]|uniref:tRNA uridine-5-carboxymethylaminomethyl(34) synthesis enzyme MnmG n=1 Tax=uncultured Clostridium sp. TaxID=59620 RepID=UPI0026043B19|nr:tRNA uridine-5-carboxymethylaminomethyl(34) synthesis enzyme MnmG [uncultured Clostridium sp.]